MKHASLFSGIGGFDLAAEWLGWENMFHCEWNEFGQKILKYYWPKAKSYGDITKTDFTIWRGEIDVLTGGFPCQPYSLAGKRLGKEDDRHLWPEMLRAIREIQPKWVVGENVFGITNWNGGLVFNEVQTDLETEGYEVQSYVLPAVSVNAPHRRDRVWFVAKNTKCDGRLCREPEQERAENGKFGNTITRDCNWVCEQENTGITSNSDSLRYRGRNNEPFSNKPEEREMDSNEKGNGGRIWGEIERRSRITPNSNGDGFQWVNGKYEKHPGKGGEYAQRDIEQNCKYGNVTNSQSTREQGQCKCKQRKIQYRRDSRYLPTDWQNFPTQPPVCGGNDGLPRELDRITFSKWRAESIKAYGNAIVPQVVYQIFKTIMLYENTK